MSYKKVGWKNYPDTSTPINATNLDHMDSQIQANANGIDSINESLTDYVKIVPVKLYAKTTFAPITSTDVYFAVPNVNGYKCLLGIGGVSENGFILPNRPSNTPKNGTIILSYTNKDNVAQTVEDLSCNMIFLRKP